MISPSKFNSYGASFFPGLGDLLFGLEDLDEASQEYEDRVDQLERHVSDLLVMVKRARDYVKELHLLE